MGPHGDKRAAGDNPTPANNLWHRINFVTSRTFVCRKRRGEPAGLIFRGKPPNTPGEKHDAMFRVVRDGFEWYNDRKLKKMKFNNRNNA